MNIRYHEFQDKTGFPLITAVLDFRDRNATAKIEGGAFLPSMAQSTLDAAILAPKK